MDGVLINDMAMASGIFAVTASTETARQPATQDDQASSLSDIHPKGSGGSPFHQGVAPATVQISEWGSGAAISNIRRGRAGGGPYVHLSLRAGMYTLANKLGARKFTSEEEAVAVFGESAREHFRQGKTYDHEAELASRRDVSTELIASVNGAAGNTRYSGLALIKDDNGIVANSGHEKQSFRLSVGQKFRELIELNASAELVHSDLGLFSGDTTGIAYQLLLPFTPSFFNLKPDKHGNYPDNPFVSALANPLEAGVLMSSGEDLWNFASSGDATVNLYKGETSELRAVASFGMGRFQQRNAVVLAPEVGFEPGNDGLPGSSVATTARGRDINASFHVVYSLHPQGADISARTSSSCSYEKHALEMRYSLSRDIPSGQPDVESETQTNVREDRRLVSDWVYSLQEELTLLDRRLTLVGAVRGERSSSNADPSRLFLYPKLATAYRIPALHPQVDEVKVRLAYGETGNQPQYGDKFSPLLFNVSIGGNPGSGVTGSRELYPERQREVEAGVDAVFMGGNIVAELTVYQRNISDLLLRRALAQSTGFQTELFNGGDMRTRGVEAMVQLEPFSRGELEWVSNTTFSLNRSMVTALDVPAFTAGGFGNDLGSFRIEKGQSATRIVGNSGLKADGTCCEVKKLGDTEPDFRMGFSNSFRYGDWSLAFLLDWQKGSEVINLTRFFYDLGQNSPDFVEAGKKRLKEQATHAGVYIEDASFLKLRDITLRYQLPQKLVRQVPKARSVQVSFSVRSVFTITRYSGRDPEIISVGNDDTSRNIDMNQPPSSRSFWTSLDVGF